MDFKKKVKHARTIMVMSQAEFAKELGVAFGTINRWENGLRQPTYALQRKFNDYCDKHGITFEE